MKRFHVHTGVADLDSSIAFYSDLFGAAPNVAKPDYAKWMLDDPRVNFAISSKPGMAHGIEHLGIEAESPEELADIYDKLERSGRPVFDEGEAKCCYAKSTKNWVADPDGVIWEAFHTHGDLTSYGEKLDTDAIIAAATAKPAQAPRCG
jgi:catechol 2,3-dioxygenase-like lactoylglutathione lyase family enzyme